MAEAPGAGSHHGKKRPAECDPDGDQPLAKKFDRLQIDPLATQRPAEEKSLVKSEKKPSLLSDSMILDDTKHTVYIHDLAGEIEEIEDRDRDQSIVPSFMEKLSSFPRFFIPNSKPKGNELVLYRGPACSTASEEEDGVRFSRMQIRGRAPAEHTGRQDNADQGIDSIPPPDIPHTDRAGEAGDAMDLDVGH